MAVGPWTSVVSYHTDPDTCGVARFSAQLAQRLGVPLCSSDRMSTWGPNPLLSVKFSEWGGLQARCDIYDQLWHDDPGDSYRGTGRVWKLYDIGVPALVDRPVMAHDALFTFGMAHKIDLDRFRQLAQVFQERQLWVSTAAHEGAGPSKVAELLEVWGPNARNLGQLSDAALQLVWPRCFAFVAFFEHGLRANNSSVHAALDAGALVITNHGPQTPQDLRLRTIDLPDILSYSWPRPLGSPYTWPRLLKELGCDTRS